jgi:hypothetical protein
MRNQLPKLPYKMGGRRKGTLNKITQDIRGLAQRMISDPAYVIALNKRMRKGTAGAIELLIWHYAYGKPVETTRLIGSSGGAVQIKVVHEHHEDAKPIDAQVIDTQQVTGNTVPWFQRPVIRDPNDSLPALIAPSIKDREPDTTSPDPTDADADETEHVS